MNGKLPIMKTVREVTATGVLAISTSMRGNVCDHRTRDSRI